MAKCCYCSLCVWPCPTECIVMTEVFEFAEPKRENLIYHYATMDEAEADLHKSNWKEWEVEANALRAKQAAERAANVAEQSAATPQQTSIVKPPPFAAKPGRLKHPPFTVKPPTKPPESE